MISHTIQDCLGSEKITVAEPQCQNTEDEEFIHKQHTMHCNDAKHVCINCRYNKMLSLKNVLQKNQIFMRKCVNLSLAHEPGWQGRCTIR